MTVESETEVKTKTEVKTDTKNKVKLSTKFIRWLRHLKDGNTRVTLVRRLYRVESGTLGDYKCIGEDIYELKEICGTAWRMYFIKEKNDFVIYVISGGDKSSQSRDIEKFKKYKKSIFENERKYFKDLKEINDEKKT